MHRCLWQLIFIMLYSFVFGFARQLYAADGQTLELSKRDGQMDVANYIIKISPNNKNKSIEITGTAPPGSIVILEGNRKNYFVGQDGKFLANTIVDLDHEGPLRLYLLSTYGELSEFAIENGVQAKISKIKYAKINEWSNFDISGHIAWSPLENWNWMGDANFHFIPESILGLENKYFSKYRWDLGISYKKNLSGVTASEYDSITTDLQYHVLPISNAWSQRISVIASYQSMQYSGVRSTMLGAGFSWAKPLFQPVDWALNQVPYFRLPKWFWVDGMMYFASDDSNVEIIGTNFKAGAGLKMYVSKSIYFESKTLVENYNLKKKFENKTIKLNLYSVLLGAGIDF